MAKVKHDKSFFDNLIVEPSDEYIGRLDYKKMAEYHKEKRKTRKYL